MCGNLKDFMWFQWILKDLRGFLRFPEFSEDLTIVQVHNFKGFPLFKRIHYHLCLGIWKHSNGF